MKRVSFMVAKALKEAGYPQDYKNAEDTYTNLDGGILVKPTYIEVWLWLWREKQITIDVDSSINHTTGASVIIGNRNVVYKYFNANDPEEAIIAAIDYLTNDNRITQ